MVKRCVRVYIEGGSVGQTADRDFRRGWKAFLNELHELARENGYRALEVVRGKGRADTFRKFKAHRTTYPDDVCVLLVDSETPVPEGTNVWEVVAHRPGDQWVKPDWVTDRHLYLMVIMAETWLLTDQQALQKFFKQGFNVSGFPITNLESRSKAYIEQELNKATKNSKKGAYRHGQAHEVIEVVSPEMVKTLTHGARLFTELANLIVDEA